MTAELKDERLAGIIESLPVEEKFFAVALVFLDSLLAALAFKTSGTPQIILVLACVFVILVIVFLVWWMRVDQNRRLHAQTVAESLHGTDKFAESLAEDICDVFAGSLFIDERLSELEREAERELPYEMLCDAIANRETLSDSEKHFSAVLARRVMIKAKLRNKWAGKDKPPLI